MSATVDMLPNELVMKVFGLVDTRSLLTAVPAVCKLWRRLCRECHGFQFDLYFLKNHPRVQRGDVASIFTVLSKRWRWVDAVLVNEWQLTHNDVAMLLDAWPTLTTVRCGNIYAWLCSILYIWIPSTAKTLL